MAADIQEGFLDVAATASSQFQSWEDGSEVCSRPRNSLGRGLEAREQVQGLEHLQICPGWEPELQMAGVGGGHPSLSTWPKFSHASSQTPVSRAEYECFQIELSKNYGMAEWREDVKKILLKAGLHSLPITFLFSDTQVPLPQAEGRAQGGLDTTPSLCGILESGRSFRPRSLLVGVDVWWDGWDWRQGALSWVGQVHGAKPRLSELGGHRSALYPKGKEGPWHHG